MLLRSPARSGAPGGAAAVAVVLTVALTALTGCSSRSSSDVPVPVPSTGVAGGGAVTERLASCADPEATVTPDVAAPGERVTVSATGQFGDCDDTGLGTTPLPAQDLLVVLWQGGPDIPLAVVDASGEDADVEVVVTVPEDAAEGEAVIAVGPGQTTPNLTIRR